MKYKLFQSVLLIVISCALSGIGFAQGIGDRNRAADGGDGNYGLQGRVILPNGKPAINANISISSVDSPGSSTTTNEGGVFQVGSLRAGNYTIVVRVPGLPVETERLTIDRGSAAGRTFNLVVHMRTEAQPIAETPPASALLKDVPKAAVDKFRAGQEKLGKNDYKGAVAQFDEAIKIHPSFAAAHYEKGSAYLREKDLDRALESFVNAISAKPDYLEAKYSVGFTQFQKKNYEVAAAVFDDVIKQKRDMPEAHMYLGISLYYLKNVDAAEAFLRSAVTIRDSEGVALAHRYLGGIYIQKKRNSDAAAELQKYLDLVPKAPDADRLKATIEDLKEKILMLGADNKTTALVFIRLVLCAIMFIHGAARIANGTVDDFGAFLSSQGFPLGFFVAWGITLFELVGSVLLAAGFYAWILAVLFALHIAAGIALVHWKEGWFVVGAGRNGMEFSVLLVASFLAIAYAGYKRGGR